MIIQGDGWAKAAIFVALAVVAASRTIVSAVLPPLGREIGLTESSIGILFTAGALALMLCGPFWGRLSDRFGRRPIALTGLLSLAATNVAFVYAADEGISKSMPVIWVFGALFVSRAVAGFGSGATQPSGQAWLIDLAPADRRIGAISFGSGAMSLGSVLGPAIGGLLGAVSLLAPFWFSTLVALASAAALMLLPEPRRPERPSDALRLKASDPRIRFHLIIRACLFSLFAGIQQTAGFLFQDRLHLDAQETARDVGMGLVFTALASLGAQALVTRIPTRSPRAFLIVSFPVAFAGYGVLWSGGDVVALCAGLALLGFSFGFWGPATAAAPAVSVAGHEQGALAGLSLTASGLGFVIGPLAATAVYGVLPSAIFPVSIGLLAILGLVIVSARR